MPHQFRHNGHLSTPSKNLQAFLEADLRTLKLNKIQKYLWLAGLSRPSRPLHRQKLLRRELCLTEIPDEHLVWHDGFMFIKPIPEYLLDFDFWIQHLCADEALHKSACGLLLSYGWLICHKSDLQTAYKADIMPKDVTWEAWTEFMVDFAQNVDMDTDALGKVDGRYWYGELRLSRLNSLYRVGAAGFSIDSYTRGFMTVSTRAGSFFQNNFGWILAVFIYFSVILSAMQVALATEELQHNLSFNRLSYGVSILSITVVLATVAAMFLVWFVLFWFHVLSASTFDKKMAAKRQSMQSLSG